MGTVPILLLISEVTMRFSRTVLLLMLLATVSVPAFASDPIGVYALIDKVVLEPNTTSPQRIQIWGVFAVAKDPRGDYYERAQRGYLYYSIDPAKPEVSRTEWADLKAVAGKGQAIGFGSRRLSNGRIRKADEKPESPDTYPVGWGLVKMLTDHLGPSVERDLRSVPPSK
jgi:hypothetical protein